LQNIDIEASVVK